MNWAISSVLSIIHSWTWNSAETNDSSLPSSSSSAKQKANQNWYFKIAFNFLLLIKKKDFITIYTIMSYAFYSLFINHFKKIIRKMISQATVESTQSAAIVEQRGGRFFYFLSFFWGPEEKVPHFWLKKFKKFMNIRDNTNSPQLDELWNFCKIDYTFICVHYMCAIVCQPLR